MSARAALFCLALVGCRPQSSAAPTHTTAAPLELLSEATDLDPDPDRLLVELTAERAADGSYRYSGLRPGPVLRIPVGGTVEVRLDNRLDGPTTIHWHGVGVPFEMDGVPWMVGPVAAGARFTYRFVAERAGTFWYHPHFDTEHQVDLGLYGLLIVEDPAEPSVDEELLLVVDDPDETGRHPVYGYAKPRAWTVNGQDAPASHVLRGGDTVRVRVLNASNTGYLALTSEGVESVALANDQGIAGGAPDAAPWVLGPGDRLELELRVGTSTGALVSFPYSLNGGSVPWGAPTPLVEWSVQAPAAAPTPKLWDHPSAAPSEDPGYTDIIWTLTGSDRSGVWAIDGERFPDIEIEEIDAGVPTVIEVRNLSSTHHPFHLHGDAFEVLSIDGVPPARRRLEDTLDIGIFQRARLLLTSERAGDWMAHCHILPHAELGMMTVLRVREP